jgi:hypothetical protein
VRSGVTMNEKERFELINQNISLAVLPLLKENIRQTLVLRAIVIIGVLVVLIANLILGAVLYGN